MNLREGLYKARNKRRGDARKVHDRKRRGGEAVATVKPIITQTFTIKSWSATT